jgi:dihydrofolate reductase
MTLSTIIFTDQNNAVGTHKIILTYLPAYIDYLEELTSGSPVIASKATFEIVGPVLRNDRYYVLSKDESYFPDQATRSEDLQAAISACHEDEKIFVLADEEIFPEAISMTEEVYRTYIYARFNSSSFYPDLSATRFEIVSSECIKADEKNRLSYCVEKWERRKSQLLHRVS